MAHLLERFVDKIGPCCPTGKRRGVRDDFQDFCCRLVGSHQISGLFFKDLGSFPHGDWQPRAFYGLRIIDNRGRMIQIYLVSLGKSKLFVRGGGVG